MPVSSNVRPHNPLMFASLLQFLTTYQAEILKIVGVALAPGGIWFWHEKYKNRVQIKVRKSDFAMGDKSLRGIEFKLENIGPMPIALEPKFQLIGYSPERQRQVYNFNIDTKISRQLPQHIEHYVLAWHNDTGNRVMLFLWFMVFRLKLTNGKRLTIRIRNAHFQEIRFFKFHWERLRFLLLGRLPSEA